MGVGCFFERFPHYGCNDLCLNGIPTSMGAIVVFTTSPVSIRCADIAPRRDDRARIVAIFFHWIQVDIDYRRMLLIALLFSQV